MHPRHMTVTELEKHYMQGEFKPESNMTALHPRHMTDSELARVINSFSWARGVGLPTDVITEYDERAMEEECKRIKSIESREEK